MVQEGAEQQNERFFRHLAIERRTAFLESVGYQGHSAEDLRDESFLYPGDEPPFTIAEDGAVFSTRDGRPITDYAQTLAGVWYWQEVDRGSCTLTTTRRPRRCTPLRGTSPSRGSGWTSGTYSLPQIPSRGK
jgi:hypothetical protein